MFYVATGHSHLADEGMMIALRKLFDEQEGVAIYGGGDVVPHWINWKEDKNYCFGVGVCDPLFFNKKSYNPLNIQHFDRLRDFDRIAVRGEMSQQVLLRFGIDSVVTGDTALLLEPTKYHEEKTGLIGINLVTPKSQDKHTQKVTYIRRLINVCNELDAEFVLLPLYPTDFKILEKVNKKLKRSEIKDYVSSNDVQGFIDEVSTLDLMIGERFHSCIYAACCYVPFVSLEYQPKKLDLKNLMDINLRIDQLTEIQLAFAIGDALRHKLKIKDNVTQVRKSIRNFAELIRVDVKAKGDLFRGE